MSFDHLTIDLEKLGFVEQDAFYEGVEDKKKGELEPKPDYTPGTEAFKAYAIGFLKGRIIG